MQIESLYEHRERITGKKSNNALDCVGFPYNRNQAIYTKGIIKY